MSDEFLAEGVLLGESPTKPCREIPERYHEMEDGTEHEQLPYPIMAASSKVSEGISHHWQQHNQDACHYTPWIWYARQKPC